MMLQDDVYNEAEAHTEKLLSKKPCTLEVHIVCS